MVALQAYPVLSGNTEVQFIGGAELQQTIVAKELARRGHKITVICADHTAPAESRIADIRVLNAYRPNAGLPGVRFLWPRLTSLWRCMKLAAADIYYMRTAGHLAGQVTAFCQVNNRKSVFASAGNPDFERNTSRVPSSFHRSIYEYGLRHVDSIFVQNEEQRDLCTENFQRTPTLIPNCYPDPGSQKTMSAGNILWVSAIRGLKRPEIVLQLARALPHRHFTMIGGPYRLEQALFEAIKRDARDIANLEFLGFVPYSDIDHHFDNACLVINTSESEGFPNTFLQAWSRGVPTASFVDCSAHFRGEPVGVNVNSVEEMAATIESLASNEQSWQAQSRLSRHYYELVHKPENVIPTYENAFRQLLRS